MKNLLLVLLLALCNASLSAQPLTTTAHDLNSFEINNYVAVQQQNLSNKICKLISDKKISPFTDSKLTTVMNTDSFGLIEQKQIPNPNNPDDIYDLIDTIIYHPANPSGGWFVFLSDKVFCFLLSVKDSVFIEYTTLNHLLTDEEKTFISFIRHKVNTIHMVGQRFSLPAELAHIRNKLWQLAFVGAVKPYRDDNLETFYSINELKVEASSERKKYDDDIYYIIDSANVPLYPIDSFNRIIFLYEWKTGDGFAIKTHLKALAPALQGYYGNKDLYLNQGALFWAKWQDIETYFTKEELAFYRYLFLFTLKKSVGKTNYKFIRLWGNE